MTFGECAAALWPLAARALGWTADTFWTATPAELAGAFAEPAAEAPGVTRADLERMMEQDNG